MMNNIKKTTRRQLLLAGASGAAGALMGSAVLAQDTAWPNRPIRLVVPYSAGGSTDQLARAIERSMSTQLGQAVVIDNKPGAGGSLGAELVAHAPADGYTLLFGNSAPSGLASLLRKLPYDVTRDFKPVSTVAFVPLALVVSTKLPVKNLADLKAYEKDLKRGINYGSVGTGSMAHLTGEYFNEISGMRMVHIPYSGGGALGLAVASGEVETGWFNPLDATAIVASGKARYLAIATAKRVAILPDVATVAESYPGFESNAWFGVLAPASTPAPVVERLNQVIARALQEPEVRRGIEAKMAEPRSSTPEAMGIMMEHELKHWGPIITKNNIKL